MRDLAAVHRLDDLRQAGVPRLKIEGRLKTAAWVRQAVSLYRQRYVGPADDLRATRPAARARLRRWATTPAAK